MSWRRRNAVCCVEILQLVAAKMCYNACPMADVLSVSFNFSARTKMNTLHLNL